MYSQLYSLRGLVRWGERLPVSNDGEIGVAGDVTLIVLVPGHLDVAVVTVSLAVRVLDEPVIFAVFRAVADHQNCVIHVSRASTVSVVKNT